jgi:Tfp pilus assembly protein PilP
MKLATGILILAMGLGTAAAQNPSIIDNTKAKLTAVQQQKTADINAALAPSHGQSANAPASSATKPAAVPAKPASSKPAASNVAAPSPASHAQAANKAQTANKPVSAAANKPSASPASQKAASLAVKPASTNGGAAQPAVQAQAANKSQSAPVSKQPASGASQKAAPAAKVSPFAAPVTTAKTAAAKADPAKAKAKTKKQKTTAVSVKKPAEAKSTVAVEDKKNPDPKKDEHKSISMAGGRRDPFISPVVNHSMGGSGCSTGKRCLAVDQIALQGIVKSDAGMIAVVVNAMNKAYFLRENDPVFNGYVVKITGDSIVFKETLQDKLGKSFTREVTKKISTPAV